MAGLFFGDAGVYGAADALERKSDDVERQLRWTGMGWGRTWNMLIQWLWLRSRNGGESGSVKRMEVRRDDRRERESSIANSENQ